MNPNKIIPEGKQKNKPVNPPPILTPEIIPETLCSLLNSPEPALNTVPRTKRSVNRIQPQGLKGRPIPRPPINQKTGWPLQDFKTTRMKSRAAHQFPVVVIQTSSPAFNINRSPEVSLLSIYPLVNCDGTSLFFNCELAGKLLLRVFGPPSCCVADSEDSGESADEDFQV